MKKIVECNYGKMDGGRFRNPKMEVKSHYAEIIYEQVKLAQLKCFGGKELTAYNLDLHEGFKSAQLSLF